MGELAGIRKRNVRLRSKRSKDAIRDIVKTLALTVLPPSQTNTQRNSSRTSFMNETQSSFGKRVPNHSGYELNMSGFARDRSG